MVARSLRPELTSAWTRFDAYCVVEFAPIDEFVNDRRYETASIRIMDAIHSVTAGSVG
jgi:hypothetical protein